MMRITPIDIEQHKFKTRTFGYDRQSVDQFIQMLSEELENMARQNHDLKEELSRTKATLNEMRKRETTLKETLLTTQKVTDELKATARREVEVMLADAELRAERIMRNAEDRRHRLIEEIQEIKRQKIDFEFSLRMLLEKHVRMLDLDLVSIECEDREAKLIEEPLPFDNGKQKTQLASTGNNPEDSLPAQTTATSAGSVNSRQDIEISIDPDGLSHSGGEREAGS
jgi:cell division initiation protein